MRKAYIYSKHQNQLIMLIRVHKIISKIHFQGLPMYLLSATISFISAKPSKWHIPIMPLAILIHPLIIISRGWVMSSDDYL